VSVTNVLGGGGGGATTDSLGHYAIVGLPAGSYYAQTSNSQGYINEVYDDIACLPYCSTTAGAPIAVLLGAATSGIDFELAGGRVAGTVADAATGLPIGGVSVSVVTSTGLSVSGRRLTSGNYITQTGLPPAATSSSPGTARATSTRSIRVPPVSEAATSPPWAPVAVGPAAPSPASTSPSAWEGACPDTSPTSPAARRSAASV
jgi:hypothetical protein